MFREAKLMKMKGVELIQIADNYGIKVGANKERTQLKESKKIVVERILKHEEEIAAKVTVEAAKTAVESEKRKRDKLTDEEKKIARAVRYKAKKAKRAEIMQDRDPKTEEFEFNGKSQTLTEWSKELGIIRKTLYRRIYYYGWTVEKAFGAEN